MCTCVHVLTVKVNDYLGANPTVICEAGITQEGKFNLNSITCHPVALAAVGKKGKCCALSALKGAVMLAT
jgi:hypothetical protein